MAGNVTKRLDDLIAALLEQSISAAQFNELNELLKSDPEARRYYLSIQSVESGLREKYLSAASSNKVRALELAPSVAPSKAGFSSPVVAMVALVLIVIAGASIWEQLTRPITKQGLVQHPEPSKLPAKSIRASLARLTNARAAAWNGKNLPIGSLLYAKDYELASGFAEITFDSGSIVTVFEGCRFTIVDANRIVLLFGELVADVPDQAVGFQVETPSGIVTDLSTRFGVTVKEDGASDIHVLTGMVEATAKGKTLKSLLVKESNAIRMSPANELHKMPFVEKKSVEFAQNSNPIALDYRYFPFDDPEIISTGVVLDHGSAGPIEVGSIELNDNPSACLSVQGKRGNALFFAGKNAKIRTDIQGVVGDSPRTIMFWTRIPKDVKRSHAYSFVNWGIPGSKRGNKWQIGWNPNAEKWCGQLGAVRTEFGGGYVIGTTDLRDGRWHHVCSVFLGGRNVNVATHIKHYVDGKLEGVSGYEQILIDTDTKGRTLGIGSYLNESYYQYFKTGFKGWLDELYVFDAALTPAQIVRVMETSIPPNQDEIVPVSTAEDGD